MVSARPITTAATATMSVPTNFAARKRLRDGSSVKVTIAVRWLHSLVTNMMPRTGSRRFIGMFGPAGEVVEGHRLVLGERPPRAG